jgi:DNA-binding MarR family transcriptional regulator
LRAAREHDGANHTALVKASGIDRSTVTDVVRRLVDAGLLQRRRLKNDARSFRSAVAQPIATWGP